MRLSLAEAETKRVNFYGTQKCMVNRQLVDYGGA